MKSCQTSDLERPMSWSESGKSVIKRNIRHLAIFSLWPLCRCPFYNVFSAIVLGFGAWTTTEGPLCVSYGGLNLEETTLTLLNTFTVVSGAVKMVFFIRDRPLYRALARLLDELFESQRKYCDSDSALLDILEGSRKRVFRLTVCVTLVMYVNFCFWMPMPLIAQPGMRRLPFVQHTWDNNSNYELSYAAQCIGGVFMLNVSFGLDYLFVAIMMFVSAQLEILVRRIEKLGLEDNFVNGEKSSYHTEKRCVLTTDEMYGDLRLCIKTHQKILRFVNHLENVMNPIAMTQFICSVLSVCLSLYQATYNADFSSVFKNVVFLPVPGGQVYFYCWAAHGVTEKAEAVSLAAFGCSWDKADGRFKRALRIVISRAKKPLVLTAGHLYPIDRAAFLSLVNATYSYYTLLCQMNNRETETAV